MAQTFKMSKKRYLHARASLKRLISKHNHRGKDGKYNGKKTRNKRKQELFKFIDDLHAHGYQIEKMRSLKQKHFFIMFDMWLESDLEGSTLNNTLSNFRRLCEWIGKPFLVDEAIKSYVNLEALELRLKREGKNDRKIKSFTPNDVNVSDCVNRITAIDFRTGLQAGLMYLYGLRRKEAAMFRPMNDINDDMSINVIKGGKGGRQRFYIQPIHPCPELAEFHAFLKIFVDEQAFVSLIPKHLTYDQWETKVSRIAAKAGLTKDQLGVTLHGLRHEYAQERYALMAGELPELLIKSGLKNLSFDQEKIARSIITESLGHSRDDVLNYYGC